MTFDRGNTGFFLIFLIIGGILGSAGGTLLTGLFPVLSIIKQNLTGPVGFNIEIISIHININLSAITGMIAGILIFRKV